MILLFFSRTSKEHTTILRAVFEKLAKAGLKLKPWKIELFFKKQIAYVGHIVSKNGVETDPKKIMAIVKWPRPSTLTDVHSFLGFTNYYRRFIPKYAHIDRPLNLLTA